MTLRALLIGAQTYGLTGVHADVGLMERALAGRGFADIRTCAGEDATYHGIGNALERLHQETRAGDAVVVHYSGHGALLPRGGAPLQYLVPVDLAESTRTDFRGYLSEELTAAVARITERTGTRNVTVILDCCHAGAVTRAESGWRLKSVRPTVAPHAALARAAALLPAPAAPVPGVVRLAACRQHGSAYEAPGSPGTGARGLFTEALVELLDATRERPLPWSVLIARARDRIQERFRQWPEAGGPAGRLPFSTEVPEQPERLPVLRRWNRLRIPGGVLFGLGRGDRVRLGLPGRVPEAGPETEVESTEAGDALLRTPRDHPGLLTGTLPPGSYAVPVLTHARRHVHIGVRGPAAEELRARVTRSSRLAEAPRPRDAFASVRARGGRLEVVDPGGLPFRHPADATPEGARDLAVTLEELARGERLRQLRTPPDGAERLDADVDVRFDVAGTALRPEGDRLHDGDHYRVRATNHSDRVLYLWLLGVGLSGRTTLVTNDRPSGITLQPDGRDGSTWTPGPTEIWWPPDVPYEGTRPETLLLLIGDSPLDMSPLVSDERERRAGRARGEPLPRLLEEVCDGVRRDSRPRSGEVLRYRVVGVHAEVVPRRRKAGE